VTTPRNALEQMLVGAARLGAKALVSGLDTVLQEVKKEIAKGAQEADARITRARRRLENVVSLEPCEYCGVRHVGRCAIDDDRGPDEWEHTGSVRSRARGRRS
jgi:hypothetical protein